MGEPGISSEQFLIKLISKRPHGISGRMQNCCVTLYQCQTFEYLTAIYVRKYLCLEIEIDHRVFNKDKYRLNIFDI